MELSTFKTAFGYDKSRDNGECLLPFCVPTNHVKTVLQKFVISACLPPKKGLKVDSFVDIAVLD